MSSTYRILCLSHDPALDTDADFQVGGTNNPAAAKEAVEHLPAGHAQCDLVIAQYSGGLIAVSDGVERYSRWVEKDWLRLLYAAQGAVPGTVVDRLSRSWPRERLRRLRDVLDLT